MALSTYAELQASMAEFLNRQDLTATIPDFIALAEAQMQRELTHWKMEATTQLAATSRYTDVPSDFIKPISLYMTGANVALRPLVQSEMQDMRYSSADQAGTECYYCITAGQIEIFPTPASDTLELYYIAEIPVLSDSNTSNWLLADAPDAYLYGSLLQTAPYLQADERIQVWASLFTAAITSLNATSIEAKWGGQRLRSR